MAHATGGLAGSEGVRGAAATGTRGVRRYFESMRTATISLLLLLPVAACDDDNAGRSRPAEKVTAARPATPPQTAPATPAAPARDAETRSAAPSTGAATPPAPSTGAAAAPSAAASPSPTVGSVEETRTNVTGDRGGLVKCLTACDEEKLSPTDKATCRMNCDSAHNVPATTAAAGAADGGVERAVECISKCHEGKLGDACVQTCKTDAGKAVNAPSAATLDQLGTCLGGCYTNKRLGDTDRETCKLNCEQIASVAGPGASKPGKGT